MKDGEGNIFFGRFPLNWIFRNWIDSPSLEGIKA